MLKEIAGRYSTRARAKRAELLTSHITVKPEDRVLDLGGGTGNHFHSIFPDHRKVVIADVLEDDLKLAREKYGYETVQVPDDDEALPFGDKEFDVVFCSSVLEHVTGPKTKLNGQRTVRISRRLGAGTNGCLRPRFVE
jgi:ubiquinone/menaquinone biosynthesis C-methylase UbiE